MNFFVYFFLLMHKTIFCSCVPLSPIDDTQYNSYALIAEGKVVRVTEGNFERTIYLSVDTCYKGNGKKTTIIIYSPTQSGMCGILPKKGGNWLMFAYSKGKSYETNLCTRTKSMNSKEWGYNKEELLSD